MPEELCWDEATSLYGFLQIRFGGSALAAPFVPPSLTSYRAPFWDKMEASVSQV